MRLNSGLCIYVHICAHVCLHTHMNLPSPLQHEKVMDRFSPVWITTAFPSQCCCSVSKTSLWETLPSSYFLCPFIQQTFLTCQPCPASCCMPSSIWLRGFAEIARSEHHMKGYSRAGSQRAPHAKNTMNSLPSLVNPNQCPGTQQDVRHSLAQDCQGLGWQIGFSPWKQEHRISQCSYRMREVSCGDKSRNRRHSAGSMGKLRLPGSSNTIE